MASEADAVADDAEALKKDVVMYDQEEDAIDAFMGSASSLSASESDRPNTMAFGNREEGYSGTRAPSSSVPTAAAAAQNASNSDANAEEANQHDNNNSSSEMAFNPADGSDSAFNFPFPSMSSNQSEEFFREQVDELCSESHAPHPHPQQTIPSDQETEEFSQLMKASHPTFEDEQSMELEVREPDQRQKQQQQQQQQQPASQLELQYADSSSKEHDPLSPAPDSRLNYPTPTQQQHPQPQDPSDNNNRDDNQDPATSSPPKQQQQKQSKAPVRPSKTTANPTSTAASGSKRAAPSPASVAASASAAASDSTQPFSWNDILRVQNMIERCLQQYLSKNEILLTLKDQAQVNLEFTSVVWQKLEEQNPSFFRAYNIQLQLKEQILAFNYLVMQQKEMMMHRSTPQAAASTATSSSSSSSLVPPLSVDPRAFIHSQQLSSAGVSSQSTEQPSGSTQPASSMSAQFIMPPPSPLPLPSSIKTDLDTHAFFT